METGKMGKAIGIGFLTIWGLILLCSFFFSILIKNTKITEESLSLTLLITSMTIMLIGGLVTGIKGKQKGWLLGIAIGSLIIIVLFFVQFLGLNSGLQQTQFLHYGGFFLACLLGSIIGVNLTSKKRR